MVFVMEQVGMVPQGERPGALGGAGVAVWRCGALCGERWCGAGAGVGRGGLGGLCGRGTGHPAGTGRERFAPSRLPWAGAVPRLGWPSGVQRGGEHWVALWKPWGAEGLRHPQSPGRRLAALSVRWALHGPRDGGKALGMGQCWTSARPGCPALRYCSQTGGVRGIPCYAPH